MKILVTGFNEYNKSFIPSNLVQHLKGAGHEVDGWEYDYDYEKEFYGWTWSADMKKYVHAIPNPGSNFVDWEYPKTIDKYDLVIHLGAISDTTETDVEKVMTQNFDFSVWLLGQCQQHNIPLHYASSASVYGQGADFRETADMHPQSPYAWSKCMFDRVVINNVDKFRAPVLGFRYFNVYGIGEEHKGNQMSPVSKFEKQMAVDSEIQLFENSENYKRDFVYVEDICKMHEKLLECKESGVYNVGTGEAVSFRELAECMIENTGASIFEIPMPDELKHQYQEYTCADLTKLNSIVDMEWTNVKDYIKSIYG
jgi:ADP-L-glycero-D-manno-heptose 6-epimerase